MPHDEIWVASQLLAESRACFLSNRPTNPWISDALTGNPVKSENRQFALQLSTPPSKEPLMRIGDKVENFTLQNQDGKDVSLTDFKGKPVVLFFYPRADTPGCTIESCGFRDAFEKFQKAGIVVLGISRDTVKDQKKFKDKYDLPYDLLADPDMELINRYDLVKPKNMYGKLVKGVKRTTYLIGADQRLIHIFEEVKPEGHAEEVLALLKKHSSKA
jgi:peroxiredoxin Q/BCP